MLHREYSEARITCNHSREIQKKNLKKQFKTLRFNSLYVTVAFGGARQEVHDPKAKTTAFQFAPLGLAQISRNTRWCSKTSWRYSEANSAFNTIRKLEIKQKQLKEGNWKILPLLWHRSAVVWLRLNCNTNGGDFARALGLSRHG